jgi:cupin 2 domain-containing protein
MKKAKTRGNLFRDLPPNKEKEVTEVLYRSSSLCIEHIVSLGQSSPEDGWYEQVEGEWVALVSGRATLEFLMEDGRINEERMARGDYRWIRPYEKHRVKNTATEEPAIWLAVFTGKD